eukprot:149527_1
MEFSNIISEKSDNEKHTHSIKHKPDTRRNDTRCNDIRKTDTSEKFNEPKQIKLFSIKPNNINNEKHKLAADKSDDPMQANMLNNDVNQLKHKLSRLSNQLESMQSIIGVTTSQPKVQSIIELHKNKPKHKYKPNAISLKKRSSSNWSKAPRFTPNVCPLKSTNP